jgi:hypothetical protein
LYDSFKDPLKWTPAVFAEDQKTVPVQITLEIKYPNSDDIMLFTASVMAYRPYIQPSSRQEFLVLILN